MRRLTASAFVGAIIWSLPAAAEDLSDVQRGGEVFRQCTACHQIGPDARNRLGPHLNNILGREAGSIEGFKYSPAMERAGTDGLMWSVDTLDGFLEDPDSFLPGGRMSFKGLNDPDDRRAVIAYLSAFSTGASNIPETPPTVDVVRDPEVSEEIAEIDGDPEYGEYLAGECTTCHQASGADEGIPSIIGLGERDFVTIMHAYKNKARDNPVMQLIAANLSNEEIAALAAYFGNDNQQGRSE